MQHIKKYQKILKISFAGLIIFSILLGSVLWNFYVTGRQPASFIFIFFIFILIVAAGVTIYISSLGISDQKKLDDFIDEIKKQEKIKLLQEVKKSDSEQEIKKEEIDINALINNVLPDMRGVKNIDTFSEKVLSGISSQIEIVQAICYIKEKRTFIPSAKYAVTNENIEGFKTGDSLPGQAIVNKELMVLNDVPESYFEAVSGLGSSRPRHLIFLPVLYEDEPIALLELSTFKNLNQVQLTLLNALIKNELGERFAKIAKNK